MAVRFKRTWILVVASFLSPLVIFTALGAEDGADGISYNLNIVGAPNGTEGLMRQSSQLLMLRDRPPLSRRQLKRRVNGDVGRFRDILESRGYYAGQVEGSVTIDGELADIEISVDSGPRYTIASIELEFVDLESSDTTPASNDQLHANQLQSVVGRPADAQTVIDAEDGAIAVFHNNGYPFAERRDRGVGVDHDARTINVVLPISMGPYVAFGSTRFAGLGSVETSYLESLVPWTTGEVFDASALETFRRTLTSSGLFTSVRVLNEEDVDKTEQEALDVDVELVEAAHRTIGIGANYSRDKGFGGSAFWEHRNFLGKAEKLRLSIEGSELDQVVAAEFRKPNFLSLDQTLITETEVKHTDSIAFREWSGNINAALERKLSESWTVRAGTGLEIASLTENGVSRTSYLASLPLLATYDTRNDILDPTSGWKVSLGTTPYAGAFDGSVAFLISEVEGNAYVPFDADKRFVFAARASVGNLVGSPTDQVPANRRFYAGGGGSVRGFGYQLVGPLDIEGEPIGGRSLIETAAEFRIRASNTIGVVPFFDAGLVSTSAIPGDGGKLRTAAGIGGRYYTAVGPLRVDIAFPLNKRSGIDKGFQFYISFGQAF